MDYYYGVVFKVDSSGNESVLYSFRGGSTDGCAPSGNLVMDASGQHLYLANPVPDTPIAAMSLLTLIMLSKLLLGYGRASQLTLPAGATATMLSLLASFIRRHTLALLIECRLATALRDMPERRSQTTC